MTSQIGPRLRELRRQAGLTQEQLAERAGLSVRLIRGLETGQRGDPRVATVEALLDALNVEPDERQVLLAAASAPVVEQNRETPVDWLAEAAHDIAVAVGARLRQEEEQRRIHDPFPLPVRWRPAPAQLVDAWGNISRARPGETVRPIPMLGDLDAIVPVYRRIPSGRLVVLGRAGSGKTTLATRFTLDLLTARTPADPVPVIFHVDSWDPNTTPLRDWLTSRLERDNPTLAAAGPHGTTPAAQLVATNRILPVLDGFDEIDVSRHRAALTALNATTMPMLVTSRPDEYQAAVEAADVLAGASAVELTDLSDADLEDYLPRTTRTRSAWDPVLADLREHSDSNLAAALTSPLMVGLARTIYSDAPDRDPAELLNTGRFGSPADIEDHLLGNLVPTAYPRGDQRWDGTRAHRWFGFLARWLHRLGTHDLALWQLGDTLRPWARGPLVGAAVGLVFCVAGGLVDWLGAEPVVGLLCALAAGLVFGLAHAVGGPAAPPSRLRLGRPRVTRWLGARFLIGLMLGVVVWQTGGLGDNPLVGFGAELVAGLVAALTACLEKPIAPAASPAGQLRTTRQTVIAQTLAIGLVFGALVGLGHGLRDGLVLGVAGGLGFALTMWGQWLVVARLWLPLTGRLPWSPVAFLDDACRRGVMRRAGAVYQFRHARLQEHLTRATDDTPAGTAPMTTTVTVTIYLSDEVAHRQVEAAVVDFLASAGAEVVDREEPVLGSWFLRMRARFSRAAQSQLAREALATAAHALDTRLVLAQDATTTAALLEHLGPVIAALAGTKEAVIRTGALLIVKIDDKVAVHQLTSAQQLRLDHEPDLATAPHAILGALRVDPTRVPGSAAAAPELSAPTRMSALSFPGVYEDAKGVEQLVWRIEPSDRSGDRLPRFEIHTNVRAVPVWGPDLDGLEPADPADPAQLTLNTAGELTDCALSGDLPCTIDVAGQRRQSTVHFALDLRKPDPQLHLSITLDGRTHTVTDSWFEDGLQRLESALPDGVRLVCCVTCLYSDYSPAGHGLMGIACHRGAKDQYLAVRSKADYWSVPITEQVPETYLCQDYQRRVRGTGYRG